MLSARNAAIVAHESKYQKYRRTVRKRTGRKGRGGGPKPQPVERTSEMMSRDMVIEIGERVEHLPVARPADVKTPGYLLPSGENSLAVSGDAGELLRPQRWRATPPKTPEPQLAAQRARSRRPENRARAAQRPRPKQSPYVPPPGQYAYSLHRSRVRYRETPMSERPRPAVPKRTARPTVGDMALTVPVPVRDRERSRRNTNRKTIARRWLLIFTGRRADIRDRGMILA